MALGGVKQQQHSHSLLWWVHHRSPLPLPLSFVEKTCRLLRDGLVAGCVPCMPRVQIVRQGFCLHRPL